MRILLSNPDTIGDMVLRQPLYQALADAGHQLMLIVRPSVMALVPFVAPGAQVIPLPMEVYRDDLHDHMDAFAGVFQQARAFTPDALVIAPYQWTQFEEKLAEELPGVRRYGMSGRLYAGDPHAGPSPVSRMQLDVVAQVQEDQGEVEKYAALTAAIVQAPVQTGLPRLKPTDLSLDAARRVLQQLGLEPGKYWIAGLAGTLHVVLKQWMPQAWGAVLSHWANRYDRRFLMVGLPQERAVLDAIHGAMNGQSDRARVWTDEDAGLEQLLALTWLSAGYAGHDTGPMHIAAAMGKPVLAVFGGGTWPRFIPAVSPSCSITVGVPCAGCGWACTFPEPYCIRRITADKVIQAVDDLESGVIAGRETRVVEPGAELSGQMIRQASNTIRSQFRQASTLNRQLNESQSLLASQVQRHEAQIQQLDHQRCQQQVELQQARAQFEATARDVEARQATQIAEMSAQFSQAVGQLSARLAVLEPKRRPPREPWKIRLAKWIAGKPYYVPLLGFRSLPKITIVTPVKNGAPWIRQCVESVLGQNYRDLEYIVVDGGSTDGTLDILKEYESRIDKLIRGSDEGMYDAIGSGFEEASGIVFGYLNCDDMLEPGGLQRVGEYFRDHRRAKIVYHEDTVTMGGWRFPNVAQPHVDVYQLLNGHTLFQDGVFFRASAYRHCGGISPRFKRAGDFEFFVRMARMWGLRRNAGHVSSFRIRAGQISEDHAAYNTERQLARQQFMANFGIAGRVRCRVIQAINLVRNGAERLLRRRKFFWPIDYCGKPYPPGEAPQLVFDKPVSPLTGRCPDRLLFSTRDTRFGDPRIHYVYYESSTGLAMAYPPMSQQQLTELYESRYSQPIKEVIPPNPAHHSPFKNYAGGNIVDRNLKRIPTPWWWFNTITYHDDAPTELLQSIRHRVRADDDQVRFLDVGCFEGDLLDKLKTLTRWKLHGLESNLKAGEVARGKGHSVWTATAEDAPLIVPAHQSFDLIFLGQTLEHLEDPLIALNRLRLVLSPGGAIVVSTPNLDSKQVEFFGPTWAHWHIPYHRTLFSRKALRRLAKLAGMKVERLRTRTHPYWSTMSVQLNNLGLGAVVPHTALFSNYMAMHGTRLTGWSRLLWDWRGRGDYMFAVLRHV
jgi:glycosyltransferase involved in cell wall biosynthesis/ADP-heptose:LPS heptosyltransferase/SAM-dependent methyltransferase